MATIERTSQFKRDYKKVRKGRYKSVIDHILIEVATALLNNQALDAKYRDHALTGNCKDHRDCHLKPDVILIYRKPNKQRLQLVRIGTHRELSL